MTGPIVAIGGAEFSMRPENEALHDYVLAQAQTGTSPRICLLPTAAGDPQDQITAFHATMERRGCEASAISLFRLGNSPIDLAEHLLSQDVIYVTGGSMVNLLALWREHRIDEIMRAAHEQGIVLCGYSAGSMCWFEQGITRGGGEPASFPGLGLLAGSHCVHYAQDPPRRDAYRRLIGSRELMPGLALDDHAAALMQDGRLVEAVRSRESAGAFQVEPSAAGGVSEVRIETRLLPASMPSGSELGLEEMRERRRMRGRAASGPSRVGHRR